MRRDPAQRLQLGGIAAVIGGEAGRGGADAPGQQRQPGDRDQAGQAPIDAAPVLRREGQHRDQRQQPPVGVAGAAEPIRRHHEQHDQRRQRRRHPAVRPGAAAPADHEHRDRQQQRADVEHDGLVAQQHDQRVELHRQAVMVAACDRSRVEPPERQDDDRGQQRSHPPQQHPHPQRSRRRPELARADEQHEQAAGDDVAEEHDRHRGPCRRLAGAGAAVEPDPGHEPDQGQRHAQHVVEEALVQRKAVDEDQGPADRRRTVAVERARQHEDAGAEQHRDRQRHRPVRPRDADQALQPEGEEVGAEVGHQVPAIAHQLRERRVVRVGRRRRAAHVARQVGQRRDRDEQERQRQQEQHGDDDRRARRLAYVGQTSHRASWIGAAAWPCGPPGAGTASPTAPG